MTVEDALDIVDYYKQVGCNTNFEKKFLAECEKALDKQIPKKAIKDDEDWHFCPNCHSDLDLIRTAHYCDECGQALDWGE